MGKVPFDKRSLDLRLTLFMDYIERNLYLMRYLLCARMTFPFIFPSSCLLILFEVTVTTLVLQIKNLP